MHTFSEFVSALFRGEVRDMYQAGGRIRFDHLLPEKDLSRYIRPSFHFGRHLIEFAVANPEAAIDIISRGESVLDKIKSMPEMQRYAILNEGVDGQTYLQVVDFEGGMFQVETWIYGGRGAPKDSWVFYRFPDENTSKQLNVIAALSGVVLIEPDVEFFTSPHSQGIATMNESRAKRGKPLMPEMKVFHLTKRIRIGRAYLGGTHASPIGHLRTDHYRHSKKPHPGWEPVMIDGAQYYRTRVREARVKGGPTIEGPLDEITARSHRMKGV